MTNHVRSVFLIRHGRTSYNAAFSTEYRNRTVKYT